MHSDVYLPEGGYTPLAKEISDKANEALAPIIKEYKNSVSAEALIQIIYNEVYFNCLLQMVSDRVKKKADCEHE